MKASFLTLLIAVVCLGLSACSQENSELESNIDNLIGPLLKTNNFSGTVLVSKNGHTLFTKAYGKMNREYNLDHKPDTKFFLASVSMIFTAAAIMKLHEHGKLSIHDKLSKYFPDYKHGDSITLHHMLAQRSGIPAIGFNGNVDYDSITKFNHNAESLIRYFKDYDLLYAPDEKYNHGRSEYIMLAGIIERISGKSFGDFLRDEVFLPLEMYDTGHYQGEKEIINDLAKGYAPKNLFDIESAYQIDWSSKTGHASIYSTVGDLQKFGSAILAHDFLSEDSRNRIFTDYGSQVGYGWFIRPHLDRKRYQMNGRSPGYSSYFAIYPDEDLLITVLSNNYISLPADIGLAIAAMVFGAPYELPNTSDKKIDAGFSENLVGKYRFNENFYVPNYELEIKYDNGYLKSQWGDLIPVDKGKQNIEDFILRTYWSSIRFIKSEDGAYHEMHFDGHQGKKVK